jgi:predicted O-methyltransferase YrrM
MTAAGLAAVCEQIDLGRRRVVVECGSGYSTIVLARLLRRCGGAVTSLEHSEAWARRVGAGIDAEGLGRTARVLRAPLGPQPLMRPGLRWYAQSALGALPERIDLLLVDGPPAGEPGLEESRYPALPLLAGRLAPDAVVVLDDIDRAGEQRVLAAWQRETDYRFESLRPERIALGRRA